MLLLNKKIKELFPSEDEEGDDSDSENAKNLLLKTIYFPKNNIDIGYLTDMLPKPTYDNEYPGLLTERKSIDKISSKSSMFPEIHKSPMLKLANKKIKKIKNTELKSTSSIESLKHEKNEGKKWSYLRLTLFRKINH